MDSNSFFSRTDPVDISDLQSNFLSLRIGEEIPMLDIKEIKKITNPSKEDNLPGTDFKYLIETRDNKILMVNSWILWKSISQVLREVGRIQTRLYLKHTDREKYTVRSLN